MSQIFFKGRNDIGIDLGTATVIVYVKGKGIILNEPSVVAIDRNNDQVLAIGEEARQMIGRTPGNIVAIRPLREGVIADYETTEKMLRYFIHKVCGRRLIFKPRIMVCVPSGTTTVEKRAVIEAAAQAGGRETFLMEEPLAAALGAGVDISQPSGNMIVDIGGGTTDVAVLSLGGIVVSDSIRLGGDKFDDAIITYMKRKYNLAIGERTAEEIKIKVGTAYAGGRDATIDARGRHLVTGLPQTIALTSDEVYEAMRDPVDAILSIIRSVLDRCPPELSADIIDKGIIMTGGGALLHGLDKLISNHTEVPAQLADDPISCVAIGTGKALESLNLLKSSITRGKYTKRR